MNALSHIRAINGNGSAQAQTISDPTDERQADNHRRDRDDIVADGHIATRRKLIDKLGPFVLLADQNLAPMEFALTVAARLTDFAVAEENRRRALQLQ